MSKYLKMVWVFLKLSWLAAMEYRADFFIGIVIDTGWGVMDLIFFSTLVSSLGGLGGWNRGEVFVVVGLFRLLAVPVWAWMYASFSFLPRLVSQGELDMVLTKPVDSQFGVSFRRFSINMIGSIMTGSFFIAAGYRIIGQPPHLANALYLIWLLVVAVFLAYGMFFASVAPVLFFDRLNNVASLFTRSYDASKYPKEIYIPILQRILTTIWPVALILGVPAETLFGRPSWGALLWFHLVTLVFLIGGRVIWQAGLRRYASASS